MASRNDGTSGTRQTWSTTTRRGPGRPPPRLGRAPERGQPRVGGPRRQGRQLPGPRPRGPSSADQAIRSSPGSGQPRGPQDDSVRPGEPRHRQTRSAARPRAAAAPMTTRTAAGRTRREPRRVIPTPSRAAVPAHGDRRDRCRLPRVPARGSLAAPPPVRPSLGGARPRQSLYSIVSPYSQPPISRQRCPARNRIVRSVPTAAPGKPESSPPAASPGSLRDKSDEKGRHPQPRDLLPPGRARAIRRAADRRCRLSAADRRPRHRPDPHPGHPPPARRPPRRRRGARHRRRSPSRPRSRNTARGSTRRSSRSSARSTSTRSRSTSSRNRRWTSRGSSARPSSARTPASGSWPAARSEAHPAGVLTGRISTDRTGLPDRTRQSGLRSCRP